MRESSQHADWGDHIRDLRVLANVFLSVDYFFDLAICIVSQCLRREERIGSIVFKR